MSKAPSKKGQKDRSRFYGQTVTLIIGVLVALVVQVAYDILSNLSTPGYWITHLLAGEVVFAFVVVALCVIGILWFRYGDKSS